MSEQTSSTIVIDAPRAQIMDVIADFEAYPEWATGMKSVEVVTPGVDGARAETVRFVLDVPPIKDEYTLAYTWSGDEEVTWKLVKGGILKALDGAYTLVERPSGGTEVTYLLSLEVSIPLIGMLRRKGEKILIDAALKGLKKRVDSLG